MGKTFNVRNFDIFEEEKISYVCVCMWFYMAYMRYL